MAQLRAPADVPFFLIRRPELVDVVDDEWRRDKLPDDEVPLPDDLKAAVEDPDADAADPAAGAAGAPEGWAEMGLEGIE